MKMPKGQGTYTYADGYTAWYHGLSAQELKNEIRIHGKVVSYKPGP